VHELGANQGLKSLAHSPLVAKGAARECYARPENLRCRNGRAIEEQKQCLVARREVHIEAAIAI
jgi:hypothetical protein